VGIIEKAAGKLAQAGAGRGVQKPSAPVESVPVVDAPQPASIETKTQSKKIDLDLARLHELGMITPDGPRTGVAEEFRAIKRSLITNVLEHKGESSRPNNLIMVTSALPGEGKTFCSINLAISIAMEFDHTVLLIDADVARPSVPKKLGIEVDQGLMDVLLEPDLDVADVMLKTNIERLTLLPAGMRHRHSTELLASKAMNNFLHEIAHRYNDRIVIFDSPPLLLTTESRALATRMGQIVMVVEGEKTTQYSLKNALRQIESCPNINLIYNKAKAFRGLENYGYYYN
jgi:protein-tyrosine kinase